ncbi:MAG TPA: hypothetical protein VLI54_02550 [Bacillota bacterium]|nr:hypothetical protein [Bacillota bacterium]
MTAKTKNTTDLRTPLTVDQFGAKMQGLYMGVVHGDDPAAAARKARDSWRLLDPIDTARGPEADNRRARLSAALGRATVIADEASGKKIRNWPVTSFRAGLLLDQAGAEIALGKSGASTKANLEHVVAAENETGKTGRKDVDATFDALSAKAMLLHMRSRDVAEKKMEPWQRRGSEAILKAELGTLIKDSVSSLRDMNAEYEAVVKGGKAGTHLSGRLVESMYFTYQLMSAYKTDSTLANRYPRYALFREDKPLITPTLRRSFDVAVVHNDTEPDLYQIKSGHGSTYADGITVWSPPQGDIVGETTQVMGWFDTIVDNEATDTDMQTAWRNLNTRFADPAEAAR